MSVCKVCGMMTPCAHRRPDGSYHHPQCNIEPSHEGSCYVDLRRGMPRELSPREEARALGLSYDFEEAPK